MTVPTMQQKIPKGYRTGRLQQFTPEQMDLFKQMFGHVGPDSYLSKLAQGDESTFNQMEAPSMRQFNELQSNIGNRFSAAGSQRSSGFKNAMTQGTSNFAQDLASRRQQLQQQAIQELMGLSQNLLGQSPFQNFMIQKQQNPSFGSQMMAGLAPLAGAGIGGVLGGPMGAAAGAQIGGAFGSGFSGQPANMNFQGIGDMSTTWG